MLSTRFVTGSPSWLDVTTPDLDGAKSFYQGLFGWTWTSAGPEAGGYGTFANAGKTVAGIMPTPVEQAAPQWTVYFQADAADATKAVQAAGGKVTLEPMDVLALGRMAVYEDPAGAAFAVWQPGTHKGVDQVMDRNSLCWLELYTTDTKGAESFYSSVFGWDTVTMPLPGGEGDYTMANPAGEGQEAMFGGIVPLDSEPDGAVLGPYWTPYFEVADADATVSRAEELGGAVRMAPVSMEGIGRAAKLTDPYGARFAILASATSGN
ncbi:VOC family protein [Streptomyces sp. ODS28]|uniref:VOC family protein n=1 Tax=Streptomyces sp. ODS28 TaxID=3136688 RepID=UPI0031ED8BC3